MRDQEVKLEEVKASQSRWSGRMGYLRREKWIRDKNFVSGRGECVCEELGDIGAPSMLRLIRRAAALARMLSTLDLSWE